MAIGSGRSPAADMTGPSDFLEAVLKNRQKRFVIDGEAVILGVDGISDFNTLHPGKYNEEVLLCCLRHARHGWRCSAQTVAVDGYLFDSAETDQEAAEQSCWAVSRNTIATGIGLSH